jgi:hypothetical protein
MAKLRSPYVEFDILTFVGYNSVCYLLTFNMHVYYNFNA